LLQKRVEKPERCTIMDKTKISEDLQKFAVFLIINASAKGNLDHLKTLVEKGTDINSFDYDKRTALHLACSEGQMKVVKWLVKSGANVAIEDRWKATPLHSAIEGGFTEIASYLIKHGAQLQNLPQRFIRDLQDITTRNEVEKLKVYLLSGVDANISDNDDRTLLHLAAMKGALDSVKFLTQNGADISRRDCWGLTAIAYAKKKRYTDIVEIILESKRKRGGLNKSGTIKEKEEKSTSPGPDTVILTRQEAEARLLWTPLTPKPTHFFEKFLVIGVSKRDDVLFSFPARTTSLPVPTGLSDFCFPTGKDSVSLPRTKKKIFFQSKNHQPKCCASK